MTIDEPDKFFDDLEHRYLRYLKHLYDSQVEKARDKRYGRYHARQQIVLNRWYEEQGNQFLYLLIQAFSSTYKLGQSIRKALEARSWLDLCISDAVAQILAVLRLPDTVAKYGLEGYLEYPEVQAALEAEDKLSPEQSQSLIQAIYQRGNLSDILGQSVVLDAEEEFDFQKEQVKPNANAAKDESPLSQNPIADDDIVGWLEEVEIEEERETFFPIYHMHQFFYYKPEFLVEHDDRTLLKFLIKFLVYEKVKCYLDKVTGMRPDQFLDDELDWRVLSPEMEQVISENVAVELKSSLPGTIPLDAPPFATHEIKWTGPDDVTFVRIIRAMYELGWINEGRGPITHLTPAAAKVFGFTLGGAWQQSLSDSIHKTNSDYFPPEFEQLGIAYEKYSKAQIEKRSR